MLIGVDLPAFLILLMLDLLVFLRREVAAVVFAIGCHFVVDFGFVMFDVRSFMRRQLAGLDSVGDATLLIEAAPVHGVHGGILRMAVVIRHPLAAVLARGMLVRKLLAGWLKMLLMHRGALIARGARHHAARTIPAVMVDRRFVNHRAVFIHIAHNGPVHVHHRSVVSEDSAVPASAEEADAAVMRRIRS